MECSLAGNVVVMLAEKALWIPSHKILVIADLHLGKIEHFRNAGIALPGQANLHTLHQLAGLLEIYKPKKVLFLGDLFHSVQNRSFTDFHTFLSEVSGIEFVLVLGNHDIMPAAAYQDLGIVVVNEYFIDNLWLTHEPQSSVISPYYNLAGHIHPGIKLKGKGKQTLTLPCFYFNEHNGILPAFGYFTGKAMLEINNKCTIFAIADNKIIHIPTS
jgi:uncharacterized protein